MRLLKPISAICHLSAKYNIQLILSNSLLQNLSNPSCIDLFLTNSINCFQKSSVFETVLSDFHKLIVTVMKYRTFLSNRPKLLNTEYRNYKGFNETKLRNELTNILHLNLLESRIIEFFIKIYFLKVLNKHVPIKMKCGKTTHILSLNN